MAAMLSLLDRLSLNLMVPAIQSDLGLSDLQISLLQGFAFASLYALAAIPLGWLVDHVNRRAVVGAGVAFWSLMTAASGLTAGFPQLFLARVGVGFGEAALQPASQSLIADLFTSQELPWAMTVHGIGSVLGAAVAFAVGGAVIAEISALPPLMIPVLGPLAAWQTSFIVLGVPGLLLAPLIAVLVREGPRRRVSPPAGEFATFARGNAVTLALLFGGISLLMASSAASSAWLPTFLLRRFGWQAGQTGLVLGAVVLTGTAPGGLACGWLAARWTRRGRADAALRVMVRAHLIAAPFEFLPFLMPKPAAFFTMIAPAVVLGAAYVGLAASAVQAITPQGFRGRVAGFHLLVTSLSGMTAGPLLVALLTEKLFADEAMLGLSLGLAALGLTVAGIAMLAAAGPAYRRALTALPAGG
ncbi:MAG TPA: MFS transporter [Acetobacteraceae bacterium]